MSSRPANLVWRLATSWGSKDPSRSRGVSTCTGPRSVCHRLGCRPVADIARRAARRPADGRGDRSAPPPSAVSITRPANSDSSPPGPVISSGSRPFNASCKRLLGQQPRQTVNDRLGLLRAGVGAPLRRAPLGLHGAHGDEWVPSAGRPPSPPEPLAPPGLPSQASTAPWHRDRITTTTHTSSDRPG